MLTTESQNSGSGDSRRWRHTDRLLTYLKSDTVTIPEHPRAIMQLDVPTLMVMQSFAIGCAGAVLLLAWLQSRDTIALAICGFAHLTAAAGLFALMLGAGRHQPALSGAGSVLMTLAASLVWSAFRSFDGRPTSLSAVFAGPASIGIAIVFPLGRDYVGTVGVTAGVVYMVAAVRELWRGRDDRLFARRPLIGLVALQAATLSIGIHSTLTGSTGVDTLPRIMSLFGLIYFESIAFALGTAAFLIALVKERSEAASRTAARTDPLTGIANRAALLARGAKILARSRHDHAPVSVLMFDLDRFKSINDRYGHAVGDAVLQRFCEIAAAALRPQDALGRLGGEEFAMVLPGSSIEAACARAERIRAGFVESCRFIRGHQVNATVSGGVAVSANSEDTLDMLLEYSDAALYEAKAEGRNRIKRARQPTAACDVANVCRVA